MAFEGVHATAQACSKEFNQCLQMEFMAQLILAPLALLGPHYQPESKFLDVSTRLQVR